MDEDEESIENLLKQYRKAPSQGILSKLLTLIYDDLYYAALGKISVNDAADVTQETIIQISVYLLKCRAETRAEFWAWCYQILRAQVAKFYYEKERNADATHPDFDEFERLLNEHAAEKGISEEKLNEAKEVNRQLRDADPDGYELIYRHVVLKETFKTIGADLGISEAAAGMRFSRCVEKYLGGNYA